MTPGKFSTFQTIFIKFSCFSRVTRESLKSLKGKHLINRAAMGRARFLLCTGFIFFRRFLTARPWAERGSCFTRDLLLLFLTARPWAERGSCFTRDLLLTARPWAERGSCFTRDLLLFFFLSVTRRKPPLGQIVLGNESRNL